MQYCEIEGKGISITLPESVRRLENAILGSAFKHGAFAETKGTSLDEKGKEQHHIAVIFPEEADEKAVQAFAEKANAAIEALIELKVDSI